MPSPHDQPLTEPDLSMAPPYHEHRPEPAPPGAGVAGGLAAPMSAASGVLDAARVQALAERTFRIEADALLRLGGQVRQGLLEAARAVLACRGRTVVMGMGKSGHVGRKIAATLASTGTPAFFVHPAEASHGDLGMVTPGDVVLAISNSGESDELAAILPAVRRLGVTVVAMTGGANSTLARHADIVLDSRVEQEACPLNLAPTASTTAQMALGDALAVVVLDARGFVEEDFARSHPGGSLGRKLLMHVADLMRSGEAVPCVGPQAALGDVLREMSRCGLGFAAVVDEARRPLGIFTDGDLRRLIESGADLRALVAQQVMHPHPKRIRANALAVEAAALMELHRVTSVIAVDADERVVGALNSHDLMRAKVI
jgi:arabinose-5-phosphate isomerase